MKSPRGRSRSSTVAGPGDEAKIQQHVRRPSQNKVIQNRAKDPDDDLELIIVQ